MKFAFSSPWNIFGQFLWSIYFIVCGQAGLAYEGFINEEWVDWKPIYMYLF